MPEECTPDDIIKDIVRMRGESMDVQWATEKPQEEPVQEDPDVKYRNDLIKSIQTLTESLQQNLSKIGKEDVQHYYVTELISVENQLRSLNDQICVTLDAANNMAMKDDETYLDFPDLDDGGDGEDKDKELLTGDITYDLT